MFIKLITVRRPAVASTDVYFNTKFPNKSLLVPGPTREWSSQSPTDALWWPPASVTHRHFHRALPGSVLPHPPCLQCFSPPIEFFSSSSFAQGTSHSLLPSWLLVHWPFVSSAHIELHHILSSYHPDHTGSAVPEVQCWQTVHGLCMQGSHQCCMDTPLHGLLRGSPGRHSIGCVWHTEPAKGTGHWLHFDGLVWFSWKWNPDFFVFCNYSVHPSELRQVWILRKEQILLPV